MILPEILEHCVWEGILQTFPTNKQGEFLTENRILKDCRNKRFLFLSPFHMSTFFFLYIDVKISNCFVLPNNLPFFFSYGLETCIQNGILHTCLSCLTWPGVQKENVNRNREKQSGRQQFQCCRPADANSDSSLHIIHKDQICNDFQTSTLISVLAAPETPNSFWYQQKRVSILCALQKSTKHWVMIWIALFHYLTLLLKKESFKTEGKRHPVQADMSCLFLHCVTFSNARLK